MKNSVIWWLFSCILISFVPTASAAVVVLDPASGFTDTIAPEVAIFLDERGKGPLRGREFVFACGAPGMADLSVTFTETGGGGPNSRVCDLVHQAMKTIISDDIILTGRNEKTGALYEIDLLSFRGFDLCYDNNAGESCTAVGGFTSYERTLVPVPAAVWLFGPALGLLGWVRRRTT